MSSIHLESDSSSNELLKVDVAERAYAALTNGQGTKERPRTVENHTRCEVVSSYA